MKKYMIIYTTREEQNELTGEMIPASQDVIFTDDPLKVDQIKMDIECGLGGYAEVYHRVGRTNKRYELWYS